MKNTENRTITVPYVFIRATFSSKVIIVLEGGSVVKNPPAKAGDTRDVGSIPGSGRFPKDGNGSSLQYSCLGNPMDRGAWWATVHEIAESDVTEQLTAQ